MAGYFWATRSAFNTTSSFKICEVTQRTIGDFHLSRRSLMKRGLGLALGAPLLKLSALAQTSKRISPASMVPASQLTPEDDAFLEEMERLQFCYFWEQTNPETGLVKDRSNVRATDKSVVASIAATGFGLTAICIGQKRGYVSMVDARKRVINTLRFLWKKLPNHRGFFYHFANLNTGERIWDSEVSSVDTAILLCGILTCRQYFENSDVNQLADAVFNRVDWTWLSEDTSLLPHGWTPEIGFLPYRWDGYSELMMMYLLGMGSSAHPLRVEGRR